MNKLNLKSGLTFGLALALLAGTGWTAHANDLQKEGSIKVKNVDEKQYPDRAKISLQEAVTAATKSFPGKVTEAELESKDDYLVWEIEVMGSDKKVTKVYVDAGNSSILGSHQA